MRDWPLLLVATLLLIGSAIKAAANDGNDDLSIALLAAGLICLGAWIAVEVRNRKDRGE